MTRPRLLDLYAGAGGSAEGYRRAGFDVVGVDHKPMPRYPFVIIKSDVLDVLADLDFLRSFDVIHASPPCQAWSRATAWTGDRAKHPKLIAVTRVRLLMAGVPYVIENVQEARRELRNPIMLCGTQFGLGLQSHRYFEVHPQITGMLPPCHHRSTDASRDHGCKQPESVFRDALGCEWMTAKEARQAIPPAYTQWLGERLLAEHVGAAA